MLSGPQPHAEPSAQSASLHKPASESYTLRELVQHFAEENNVEFLPKSGRMHDGLQVGNPIYMDKALKSKALYSTSTNNFSCEYLLLP